jgi:hypothetical protein
VNETLATNDDKTNVIKFVNSQTPILEIKNETTNVKSSNSIFKKIFLNWICGIDTESDRSAEPVKSTQDLKSLQETKFQKCILNINLVIIICISVSLFIFFSVPSGTKFTYNLNSTRLYNQ